jgi:hypothetical protein
LFHLVHLGHVFLPMYLPLMALPFFASPRTAAATALVVPLLSALLTGMPPWYPPVAPAMALELSVMAALAAWAWRRWPRSVLAVLVPALLLGRVLQLGLGWLLGLALDLPPAFLSLASVAGGLPGVVLMVVVIPALVRAVRQREPA